MIIECRKAIWTLAGALLLGLFCDVLQAAAPTAWDKSNIVTQPYVMGIMARIHQDGNALNVPGSKVAVFYGDELRGVADYNDKDGLYFYNLTVAVADTTETGYTFKYYSPADDKIHDLALPAENDPLAFTALGYGGFQPPTYEFEPLVLTVKSNNPTVQYTLTPATAKWKIDDGSWNASGAIVTTTIGRHVITFQDVTGYTTPESHTITLEVGETIIRTVIYEVKEEPIVEVDWAEVCDTNTAHNMTFALQVLRTDNSYAETSGSLVGVFNGEVCCGFAKLAVTPFGKVYEGLVYSNKPSVGGLTMKLYDASDKTILDIWEKIDFEADKQLGNEEYPLQMHVGFNSVNWTLKTGWNWVSMNVVPEDATVNTLFAEYTATAGDQIKTRNAASTYYVSENFTGWSPELIIQPGVMYMIRCQAAEEANIEITGAACPPDETIAVKAGWNWLGLFNGNETLDIAALTHSEGFAASDQLKGQMKSTTYYVSTKYTGWSGNLTQLVAGEGYKLKVANDGIISANKDNGAQTRGGMDIVARTRGTSCPWGEYDTYTMHNMTFCTVLQYEDGTYLEDANTVVGVFMDDGTCVGQATYKDSPFGIVYEGTINNNNALVEGLVIKVWDGIRGTETVIDNSTIIFETDTEWGNELIPQNLQLGYGPDDDTEYAVIIVNGTSGGETEFTAFEGDIITIMADEPEENKFFDKWIGDVAFADENASETMFVMPAHNVTITAKYKDKYVYEEWPEDMELYKPADGKMIRENKKSPVTFRWPAILNAAGYRLIIVTYGGDVVIDEEVEETTCDVYSLVPGSYVWGVTALNNDGSVHAAGSTVNALQDFLFAVVEDNGMPIIKDAKANGTAIEIIYDTAEIGYREGVFAYNVSFFSLNTYQLTSMTPNLQIVGGRTVINFEENTSNGYLYISPVTEPKSKFVEIYIK